VLLFFFRVSLGLHSPIFPGVHPSPASARARERAKAVIWPIFYRPFLTTPPALPPFPSLTPLSFQMPLRRNAAHAAERLHSWSRICREAISYCLIPSFLFCPKELQLLGVRLFATVRAHAICLDCRIFRTPLFPFLFFSNVRKFDSANSASCHAVNASGTTRHGHGGICTRRQCFLPVSK